MISFLILTAVSVFVLVLVCFLHRTSRLPRFLNRNIDMLSLVLGVFVTTQISIAAWQPFGPIPQDILSPGMAAYVLFNTVAQFIGIQLTRIAFGLPARTRA